MDPHGVELQARVRLAEHAAAARAAERWEPPPAAVGFRAPSAVGSARLVLGRWLIRAGACVAGPAAVVDARSWIAGLPLHDGAYRS